MLRRGDGHNALRKRYRALNPEEYPRRRAHVYLAAPASASRTAAAQLSALLDLPVVQAKSSPGFGHNVISDSYAAVRDQHILYGHLFPTKRNKEIVSRIAKGPVLLSYRNVFDWCLSMAEYFVRHARTPIGVPSDAVLARGHSKEDPPNDEGATSVSRGEAVRFVVDFELPWLVRFLHGWLAESDDPDSGLSVIPVSFEGITDGSGVPSYVTAIGQETRNLTAQLTPAPVGLNVGESGRGRREISHVDAEKIRAMLEYLPDATTARLPGLI